MIRSRSLLCSIALSLFCCFSVEAMNESFPDQNRLKKRENAWNETSEITSKNFTIEKLDGNNKFVDELTKNFEFYKKLSAYPIQLQYHKEFVAIINFFIQELNKNPNDKHLQRIAIYAFFMVHLACGFSLYEEKSDNSEAVVIPALEMCYSLTDYLKNRGKSQSSFSYFFSYFQSKPEDKIISEFIKVSGLYKKKYPLKNSVPIREFINSISSHAKFIEHKEYFNTLTFFRENLLKVIKKETAEKQELTIEKTPILFIVKQTLKKFDINIIDEPIEEKPIEVEPEPQEPKNPNPVDQAFINLEEFDLQGEMFFENNNVNNNINIIKLEDCLKEFFSEEILTSENKWSCSKCTEPLRMEYFNRDDNKNLREKIEKLGEIITFTGPFEHTLEKDLEGRLDDLSLLASMAKDNVLSQDIKTENKEVKKIAISRNASRKIYFKSLGKNNLCISIKRFNALREKVSTPVKIPMTLDMSSFLENVQDSNNEIFELQSFVVHSGSTIKSGHYYAYVKSADGIWRCYNDASVKTCDNNEIQKICDDGKINGWDQPFILFYKKKSSIVNNSGNITVKVGLKNYGTNCYLNALAQCLSQNEDFVTWVKGKNNNNNLIVKEFLLLAASLKTSIDCADPKGFLDLIVKFMEQRSIKTSGEKGNFSGQQDAAEIFSAIIEEIGEKQLNDVSCDAPFAFSCKITTKSMENACSHSSSRTEDYSQLAAPIPAHSKKDSKNDNKRKRDDDKENSINENNKKRDIERTQYNSINQSCYEELYKNGKNLCGLFAAYNGSLILLSLASGAQKPKAIPALEESTFFNDWLNPHFDTLEKNRKRRNTDIVGDFNAGEIVEILERDNIGSVSVVLETKDLEYFTTKDNTKVLMAFLVNKKLISCIKKYRMSKIPCLVIYNTGNHWISIVICPQGVLIADSLGKDRCETSYVNTISALFNTAVIPDEQKISEHRKEWQDWRNSKKIEDGETIIID